MRVVIEDFLVHLKTVTGLSAIKMYPTVAPKNPGDTFIVYNPRGGIREALYRGSFGLAEYSIQLDIYSKSFATNQDLYDNVVETFNGLSGLINSNTFISRGEVAGFNNFKEAGDEGYYRSTCDIILTF